MNVIVHEKDSFFRTGIECLLDNIFSDSRSGCLHLHQNLSTENISAMDVIILSLVSGEQNVCMPDLCHWQGVLIILLEDEKSLRGELPFCFSRQWVLYRHQSPEQIAATIRAAVEARDSAERLDQAPCKGCPAKRLSSQQVRMMDKFCAGASMKQIARELAVNMKTVFSHKYLVMHRFALQTDCELLTFYKALQSRPTTVWKKSAGIFKAPQEETQCLSARPGEFQ